MSSHRVSLTDLHNILQSTRKFYTTELFTLLDMYMEECVFILNTRYAHIDKLTNDRIDMTNASFTSHTNLQKTKDKMNEVMRGMMVDVEDEITYPVGDCEKQASSVGKAHSTRDGRELEEEEEEEEEEESEKSGSEVSESEEDMLM